MTDSSTQQNTPNQPLATQVEKTIRHYFSMLEGELPKDLYNLILNEVEEPLLRVVLEHTNGNQCKAAEVLGLSRGTLRKKMSLHGLL